MGGVSSWKGVGEKYEGSSGNQRGDVEEKKMRGMERSQTESERKKGREKKKE